LLIELRLSMRTRSWARWETNSRVSMQPVLGGERHPLARGTLPGKVAA
jgi:hypothetical protein